MPRTSAWPPSSPARAPSDVRLRYSYRAPATEPSTWRAPARNQRGDGGANHQPGAVSTTGSPAWSAAMTTTTVPVTIDDPVNHAIMTVSEDQLQGFSPDPFGEIARRSGVPQSMVLSRVRAMLEAGVIR